MAAKKVKATGTAVTAWDKELAEQAAMAAGQVASSLGGGGFFSIKGGMLSFGGNELPDNQMAVIILDAVRVNAWYDRPYNEGDKRQPSCYAIARTEEELEAHADSELPQHDGPCTDCPLGGKNAFNTAATGKGKACKNTWRLSVISAGDLASGGNLEDLELYEADFLAKTPAIEFSVPPTSQVAFGTYVNSLANSFKRPPHMFVTRIKVKPDKATQVKVDFAPLLDIRLKAQDLVPMLIDRHKKAKESIMHTFPVNEDDDAGKSRGDRKRAKAGQVAGREPVGRSTGPKRAAKPKAPAARRGARQEAAKPTPVPTGRQRAKAAPTPAQPASEAAGGRRKFRRD